MLTLEKYLNNKPLFYNEIDYTRMPRVYKSISEVITLPKIIHLVGTNGKGTTGRFLASALHSLSFNTGHYTSPHILTFNERIWLNGEISSDTLLEAAHGKLQNLLSSKDADSSSYFEYTTLLAMLVFQECDYIVLEAGLGGEYDATNVFDKVLSLFTPIDFDHESFLGSDIESIATTKFNSMLNVSNVNYQAILGHQHHQVVNEIFDKIAESNTIKVGTLESWITAEDRNNIIMIKEMLHLPEYMCDNLELAISALHALGVAYSISNFKDSRFFGRLMPLKKNILLDVGHNVLAAQAIVKELNEKYILVYNALADKNYHDILKTLAPKVDSVQIITIENQRCVEKELLIQSCADVNLNCSDFTTLDESKNYLIFGSFSVVESFLIQQKNSCSDD
jgi:dihydrofolate synthase/folylpolyglutamate synthase